MSDVSHVRSTDQLVRSAHSTMKRARRTTRTTISWSLLGHQLVDGLQQRLLLSLHALLLLLLLLLLSLDQHVQHILHPSLLARWGSSSGGSSRSAVRWCSWRKISSLVALIAIVHPSNHLFATTFVSCRSISLFETSQSLIQLLLLSSSLSSSLFQLKLSSGSSLLRVWFVSSARTIFGDLRLSVWRRVDLRRWLIFLSLLWHRFVWDFSLLILDLILLTMIFLILSLLWTMLLILSLLLTMLLILSLLLTMLLILSPLLLILTIPLSRILIISLSMLLIISLPMLLSLLGSNHLLLRSLFVPWIVHRSISSASAGAIDALSSLHLAGIAQGVLSQLHSFLLVQHKTLQSAHEVVTLDRCVAQSFVKVSGSMLGGLQYLRDLSLQTVYESRLVFDQEPLVLAEGHASSRSSLQMLLELLARLYDLLPSSRSLSRGI